MVRRNCQHIKQLSHFYKKIFNCSKYLSYGYQDFFTSLMYGMLKDESDLSQ